ncbi:MAG: ribonuclease P protein component [Gammaproteobacteria bacterium]|nr:ribonuclease P protein component [Gammaproteobacteria bacterium]
MLAAGAAALCFALDSTINGKILDSGKPQAVSGNLLKKTFRLRKAADFVMLTKQAKPFRHGDFLIRRLDNRHGHARLGIAIPKKIVKHAVARNRIRRIIRETFRRYCLRLPDKDYMISYRGTQNANDAPLLNKNLALFWQQEVLYYSK